MGDVNNIEQSILGTIFKIDSSKGRLEVGKPASVALFSDFESF